ncbi:DUF4386 domain-containing protein [Hyphomonas chukchiensis]|uniref:DUF4386 domain-containing protein n=1 Tax=Hyphomonas chukchiensis TaxID=1280947 RepID=UPI0030F5A4D4
MMNSYKSMGRLTGAIYLIVVLTGIFTLGYAPAHLVVKGDAAATFEMISNAMPLFRWSVAASFVCYLAFLALPVLFYRLLQRHGPVAAKLMVAFAVTSVPVMMVNLIHKVEIISMISGETPWLAASDLPGAVMQHLYAYDQGVYVATLFWGAWLLPLGYLIFRSRVLPRLLGILLMLGCAGYMLNFFGPLLAPGFAHSTISDLASIPSSLGEIGTCLWLLIMGARQQPVRFDEAAATF